VNELASNLMDSNVLRFPNYHVGHHRLNVDERSVFNAKLDLIMNSGVFRNGTFSEALSGTLVKRTGYKYAIPTDSGTTALAIITAFVNSVRKLKYIAAPSITYQATYNAIARALPNVIYDQPSLFPNQGRDRKTKRSEYPDDVVVLNRAYAPAHELSVDFMKEHDAVVTVGLGGKHDTFTSPDIIVIEDCCQDWITKPHTGNHRAISFDPNKIVTGMSGGGAILTDSQQLAAFASAAIVNGFQIGVGADIVLSPVFGKHSITEVDALHVLIMLENVQERLDARRKVMDLYKQAFPSTLFYEGEQDHDMSKALLFLSPKDENLLVKLNETLAQKNLGQVRHLYESCLKEVHVWSLPLSERFQPCPALDELISTITSGPY